MTVIRASHYQQTEDRLKKDIHILSMALETRIAVHSGATSLSNLQHSGGGARHTFMIAANREYSRRLEASGERDDQDRHMGAVATVVLYYLQPENMPELVAAVREYADTREDIVLCEKCREAYTKKEGHRCTL